MALDPQANRKYTFDIPRSFDKTVSPYIGAFYYLNYYGINVFLRIAEMEGNIAYLYEMQKKVIKLPSGEKVEVLGKNLSPSKNPLLITENN